MADAVCKVKSGICAMETTVSATMSADMMSVDVKLESTCKMVNSLGEIKGLNPYELVSQPFPESVVYQKCAECLKHTACPVPCAIVKCAEAASGMALKRPVSIEWVD